MAKRAFTTRLDEGILELAARIADAERRSVTSVLEVAVLEYAKAKGMALGSVDQPTVTAADKASDIG